jgi:ribonuclease HI
MENKFSIPNVGRCDLGDETFSQLLERMGIGKWDILLVGDGSGSLQERACGWGCVSIERKTMHRRLWYGGCNSGTVNVAEIMAYMSPLSYFANEQRKTGQQFSSLDVHILTDSSYVGSHLASRNSRAKSNSSLWQIFRQFDSGGLVLHWHHIPRDTVALNKIADIVSKLARVCLLSDADIADQLRKIDGLRDSENPIYSANPNFDL